MGLDEPHLLCAALVVGCAQPEHPVVCLTRWSASRIAMQTRDLPEGRTASQALAMPLSRRDALTLRCVIR